MMQAGVTTLTGLEGNIAIPRQTSASTAYWVGEGASPTESQQAFDQVNLTPKTVGAFVDYTRKTLLQSSIDVAQRYGSPKGDKYILGKKQIDIAIKTLDQERKANKQKSSELEE